MANPTEQAVLKAFGIPELAHLICTLNRRGDHGSLMSTCRQLFNAMLPFVWEVVDDVIALVSMIPGGGIVSYGSDILPPLVVMQCPVSLNLSRFNIYAPHVKRIVLPFDFHVDEYENWDKFLACTHSFDLLPNLESIHLSFPVNAASIGCRLGDTVEANLVNWIVTFLSSSLLALVMTPSQLTYSPSKLAWVDLKLYQKLISSVSQKCSNIQTLKVIPGDVRLGAVRFHWDSSTVRSFSFSCDSPELGLSILSLHSLVSLLVSPLIMNPTVLRAVSKLPALESLYIIGLAEDNHIYGSDFELPNESFPSLRHLELNRLGWATILNISKLKPLVSTLRSLSITYPHHTKADLDNTSHPESDFFDVIATMVLDNSKLEKLSLILYSGLPAEISSGSIESLGGLPLVTLHLEWMTLSYYGFYYRPLYRLLSSLPRLENLVFSNHDLGDFKLKQLQDFVGFLPRLRRIQIRIKWESVTELTQADFRPLPSQSEDTLCLESFFYLPDPQEESAENIARFLSTLRPASRVVCHSAQPYFYRYDAGRSILVDQEPKNIIERAMARYYSGTSLDGSSFKEVRWVGRIGVSVMKRKPESNC